MSERVDRSATALRAAVNAALDPEASTGRLSPLNIALFGAILASVAAAILETESTIAAGREGFFRAVELSFGGVFALEYLVRLWVAPERMPSLPAGRARLRWIASPPAVIDLAALLPVFLFAAGAPTLVLRLIRLLRIVRLAHMGPISRALNLVATAISARRYELGVTVALGAVLLVLASALLYVVEGAAQPATFGSIPRALWWGIVTLTTIGYGDVYPVTPLGKVLAGVTAVTGIGLIAAPTGILAASFSEALRGQSVQERED